MLVDPVSHENGASFPSGHAQATVVGYAVGLAVLMVLGIGLSRVALGVHYVSDVLAGYALGAAWAAAMIASFNVWRRADGLPPAQPEEGLDAERT